MASYTSEAPARVQEEEAKRPTEPAKVYVLKEKVASPMKPPTPAETAPPEKTVKEEQNLVTKLAQASQTASDRRP